MLKNLYFVTDIENKELYENTYRWNVDLLRNDLQKEGTDLSFVYSPEIIDANMLNKSALVIPMWKAILKAFWEPGEMCFSSQRMVLFPGELIT